VSGSTVGLAGTPRLGTVVANSNLSLAKDSHFMPNALAFFRLEPERQVRVTRRLAHHGTTPGLLLLALFGGLFGSGCLGHADRADGAGGGSTRTVIEEAPRWPTDAVVAGGGSGAPPLPQLPAAHGGALTLEYACGRHLIGSPAYSDYVKGGETCAVGGTDLNTFSVVLNGAERGSYTAIARCGYIRYDNGTFVGERVVVEARDGQWCHELALQELDLKDRMLLTDVSFRVESVAPPSVAAGSVLIGAQESAVASEPIAADAPLCLYVAHVQPGAYACAQVPAIDYCVCPKGSTWRDFLTSVALTYRALGDGL
jgi:hypothetical protein